ncbi:MAG TPA: LON peptidase substrate-binding domain-containing protein [Alphaproteobacteria bacterium]|nr:LON peptidase substrate-binding domain-containing protein [Alphaproteobacteria bacterium]
MEQQQSYGPLPKRIPIFPLPGVLLLPKARLPLNIFEPRYLDMVRDAMAGERLIGMVQPLGPGRDGRCPPVYGIGGAGRITSFRETDDGRFLITLTGLSRFRIVEEVAAETRYRQVLADWESFGADRDTTATVDDSAIDRNRLMAALRAYLAMVDLPADWNTIEKAPTGPLIDNLAMICPFGASEKQALLESPDVLERSRIITALVEMAVLHIAGGHGGERDDESSAVH